MRSSLVLVAVLATLSLALLVAARPQWHQLDNYTFDHYERDFQRAYDRSERAMRRALFERRLATIRAHNSDVSRTWKMGVNHLTDRTDEEFRVMLGYRRDIGYMRRGDGAVPTHLVGGSPRDLAQLPSSVDWRDKNVVSAVKDQGSCGSCWTFASASTIESMYAIATGRLPVLSEQHILSCTPNPNECGGTGGCAGGTAELAYASIISQGNGIASEWVYPYLSYRGQDYQCQFNAAKTPVAANISSYVQLPANQYQPLMDAVANQGPIAISVDASAWGAYESGVFNGCNATEITINHAVQLVGYGTDSKFGDYWLVRNSWSPEWGEKGYIRVSRSSSPTCGQDHTPLEGTGCKGGPPVVTVCGECGILFDSSYPIVKV